MPALGLEEVLDQCVTEIHAGRATLDECLAAFPDLRSELEPLLRIALHIPAPEIPIDPDRRMRARTRFINALHGERDCESWASWHFVPPPAKDLKAKLASFLVQASAAAVTFVSGGFAATATAAKRLGNPFRPAKTPADSAHLRYTTSSASLAAVQRDFAALLHAKMRLFAAFREDGAVAVIDSDIHSLVAARFVTIQVHSGKKATFSKGSSGDLERQQAYIARTPDTHSKVYPANAALERLTAQRKPTRVGG